MLSIVLVAGLAVAGWFYFTGRFGIGPLSAKDKAAVTAIADGVDGLEWAGDDDRECAADRLVHDVRSADLEKRGLIEPDGDDWTYTGEWRLDDAQTYVEEVLDCTDDWPAKVGEGWSIEDTDCLEDIGASTVAGYFVPELPLADGEDRAEEAKEEVVADLDDCNVSDPPAPRAKSRPGYRSVNFTFEEPEAESGNVVLQVRDKGGWAPVDGRKHSVDTNAGGDKGCVEARVEATYAWGTTRAAEKRFCGKSKPARIWWVKAKRCTVSPGCTTWDLRYEGLASFETADLRLFQNGGDCNSESGRCSFTFFTSGEGRGKAFSWSVYRGYDEHFEGRVGRLTAVLPD